MSQDFMVYDVETKKLPDEVDGGWNNVYGLGMSSAVVWASKTNQYYFFGPDDSDRERLAKFLNNQNVITFNGITFDSKVVLGNDRIIEPSGVTKNDKYGWKNIDIFLEMWKHVIGYKGTDINELIELQKNRKDLHRKGVYNLDSILWNTLRIQKNGNGLDAPKLFKENKIRELFEYNLQDTRCERDLYLFIKRHRYLVNGNYDVVTF